MKIGVRSLSLSPFFLRLGRERKFAPGRFCAPVLFLAMLASTTLVPSQSGARSLHPTQNDVEAAYLYNFGKFVHWPSDAEHGALNICILGNDQFGPNLDQIVANESIDSRHLAVVRLPDTSGIKSCAILFINSAEAPHLEADLSALAASPIMTVSDMPGFLDRGGMVQFVVKDGKVRFEVNLNATGKCGLVLSSQLLKVAVGVIGNPQGKVAR